MSEVNIFLVEDDEVDAMSVKRALRELKICNPLYRATDGIDALEILRGANGKKKLPSPFIILLDLNMPRLGGLETLSAIKSDPELYVIPVIVLSTSGSLDDVEESYKARANGFVQKPIDLERSVKLLRAIESFWMDFALLPAGGKSIALNFAEARSRAIDGKRLLCMEHKRLLDELGRAVRQLLALHEQQFQAIVDGDEECSRFDLLIHMANEQKQSKKYAYLRHVGVHGCSID